MREQKHPERTFYVEAVDLIPVRGNEIIPTAIEYTGGSIRIGFEAIADGNSGSLNYTSDFKVHLGYLKPGSVANRERRKCSDGVYRSAYELSKDFLEHIVDEGVKYARTKCVSSDNKVKVLVAEPLKFLVPGKDDDWIANYRENIRRILSRVGDIEFLPEPFAVYQYYRYGHKIPQIQGIGKNVALIIDFGGGTFDACVIESTMDGEVSQSGKHSKPFGAKSAPVGGFHINRVIARYLFMRDIETKEEKTKRGKAIDQYDRVVKGDLDPETLSPSNKAFIENYDKVVRSIEAKKIELCRSIRRWDLDAEAYEKVFVPFPKMPFMANSEYTDVPLRAHEFRKVFDETIWRTQLKPMLKECLSTASKELKGRPITITLISGGSSNIRWLEELMSRDFGESLEGACPISLTVNFQEIVAKGLAIECARRMNEPNSEFVGVTYNPIRLILNPDSKGIEQVRFSPVRNEVDMSGSSDGDLLPSAQTIQHLVDEPVEWKFRLSKAPSNQLDYYFMRPSDYELEAQPDDVKNRFNIESKLHFNFKHSTFDSKLRLQLLIRKDGTALPKFIFKTGFPERGIEEISIDGKPFYLDMTSSGSEFSKTMGGSPVYIGLDFGTSNSSISYLTNSIAKFIESREVDGSWQGLKDLAKILPYPIAFPLKKYLRANARSEQVDSAIELLESALAIMAYVAYLEAVKAAPSVKLFKEYAHKHRSMGPLKDLLKKSLSVTKGKGLFSGAYNELFDHYDNELSDTIEKLNKRKHRTINPENVDCHEFFKSLLNIFAKSMKNKMFGYFENMSRVKFSKGEYEGIFRSACENQPFYDKRSYRGLHEPPEQSPFLVDLKSGNALSLYPLCFWDEVPKEGTLCIFDKVDQMGRVHYKFVHDESSIVLDREYEMVIGDIMAHIDGKGYVEQLDNIALETDPD